MDPLAPASSLPPPAFLCGFPKSGTTLARGLLDGHPELLVIPVEVRLFRVLQNAPREQWMDYLLEYTGVRRLANHSHVIPEHAAPFRAIDEQAFSARARELYRNSDGEPRALIESVVRAFGELVGTEGRRLWVEKSPDQELAIHDLASWWPDLKTVYVVRDPRSTFVAFRKKREVRGTVLQLERFVVRWNASVRAAERHAEKHATHFLRFEDLLSDARPTLDALCAYLGIGWDETLLEPTMNGMAWGGNSMFGEEHEGISRSPADRWRTGLEDHEVAFLETWLAEPMQRMGYEPEVVRPGAITRVRSLFRGGDRGLRGKLEMLRDLRAER